MRGALSLTKEARMVAKAGRHGDTMIVHISPVEYGVLRKAWGEPTINPRTRKPEFFKFSDILKSPITSIAAPLLLNYFMPGSGAAIGEALGASGPAANALGSALLSGGLGLVGGGAKGGVQGALLGGLTGAAEPMVQNLMASGEGPPMPTVLDQIKNFAGSSSGSPLSNLVPGGANVLGTPADQGWTPGTPSPSEGGGVMDWVKKNPMIALGGGALAVGALSGAGKKANTSGPPPPPNLNGPIIDAVYNRTPAANPNTDWYTYGTRPALTFFNNNQVSTTRRAARGGEMHGEGALSTQPRYFKEGPGSGRADEIDAKVSPKEYVMDAETMSLVGDGNPDEGARRMDQFRENIRKHKGGALSKGKFSPAAKPLEAYMPGGR